MRLIIIFISILLVNTCYSQIKYNRLDSTYLFTYTQLNSVYTPLNTLKLKTENLESQIGLYFDIVYEQTAKINKLEKRDSAFSKELEITNDMNEILKSKVNDLIEINQAKDQIIMIKENDFKILTKETKKQKFWKNFYKYGYPVIGAAIGVLIITK